jgi:hypothetical protein
MAGGIARNTTAEQKDAWTFIDQKYERTAPSMNAVVFSITSAEKHNLSNQVLVVKRNNLTDWKRVHLHSHL